MVRYQRNTLLHLTFGADRGGVEGNARTAIKYLPDLEHRVVVLGKDGPISEDWRGAGAQVDVLGADAALCFSIYGKLREILRRERPAGVIAWFGLVRLPQIIRACNRVNTPLIVHGGNPAHGMPRKTDLKCLLFSRLYPPSGPLPMYACCSQYVADSFQASWYLRRFPRRVVYNGIDLPPVGKHTVVVYETSAPFVIGMTARLSPIKDHATLLHAFHRIESRFPNVCLELAGEGELRSSLAALAERLGIADRVRFLGDVGDIDAVLGRWDLFAYATTEREGLGNAVAEAMALGLPCVVTDIGPMREFSGPDQAVYLVPARNADALAAALAKLIPDSRARQGLSQLGRQLAEQRFAASRYAELYAELLGLSQTTSAAT